MLYGWKENSRLTNCLAACAHLIITVSEIERDIGRKSSFFHTRLAFDTLVKGVGGSCRNSALKFGTEKLEWLGYPMVKKFEDIFSRFGATHERGRRTPHAGNSIASHGKNQKG